MSDERESLCRARRRSRWRPAKVRSAALALGVLGLLGASAPAVAAGDGCPPGPPAPAESTAAPAPLAKKIPAPPQRILACVGSWEITGATFDHWALVARKSAASSGDRARKRHRSAKARREQVKLIVSEVMGFLLSSDWVLQEGRQLGVEVSDAVVRKRFDHLRREEFPKHGEFRKFLRSSGQTIGDLLTRVRLNMLSEAIQRHVVAGKSGKAAEDALTEFVKGFRAKWSPQTYCVSAFAVSDCGVAEPSL